jgi:arsenate reductase-like glutaredoxin family protein
MLILHSFVQKIVKKILVESEFMIHSSVAVKEVEKIVGFISDMVRTLSQEEILMIFNNPAYSIKRQFIETGKNIDIKIGRFWKSPNYEQAENTIFIDLKWVYENPTKDRWSALIHEITHGLSKRIPNASEEYHKEYIRKLDLALQAQKGKIEIAEAYPHYADPEEFDARGSVIATDLFEKQCTQKNVSELEDWIRLGGKSENTPDCLEEEWSWLFYIWEKNRPLYRLFLNRMYGLTEKMKDKLEKIRNEILSTLREKCRSWENLSILEKWIKSGGIIETSPVFFSHLKSGLKALASEQKTYQEFLRQMLNLIEQTK